MISLAWFICLAAASFSVFCWIQYRNESPDKDFGIGVIGKRSRMCWFTNRHIWEGRACVREGCGAWRDRTVDSF